MQELNQSQELLDSFHAEPFTQRLFLYYANQKTVIENKILSNTRRNDTDEKLLAEYRYELGRLDVVRGILEEVFIPEIKRQEDD